MAVKIRLHRMGAKKNPFYRIVAIDSRKSRDGEYIEQIGYYNPKVQPAEVKIDKAIAEKWLSVGAQPTDTVKALFVNAGIVKASYKKVAEAAPAEVNAVDAAVEAAVQNAEE